MASTLMLLANPYRPDPRVKLEAVALTKAGHEVKVLAWARQDGVRGSRMEEGVEVVRIGPPCPFRSMARMVMGLPRYWISILKASRDSDFDLVHSHDLDTLPAGLALARLRNMPLLYDAHELYSDMVKDIVGPIYRPLRSFEMCLVGKADAVITVSDALAEELRAAREDRPGIVMTSPDVEPLTGPEIEQVRQRYGLRGFVLSYLGSLEPGRFVEELLTSFKPEDGVSIVVAGSGSLEGLVAKAAEMPHIRFEGALDSDEALRLTAACDLVSAMMDPSNPNNVIGTPGKILNSMALGRPYITTAGLGIARMTQEAGTGLVVPYDKRAFREEVLKVKSDTERLKTMGANGRELFESKMSWKRSETELLETYERLIGAH
jgi:glycosyltransferase involved in cell wall biosynthesis